MSSYNLYSAYQVLTTQDTTEQQKINAENLFITKLLQTDVSGVNLEFTTTDISANSGIYYGSVIDPSGNPISTSLDISSKIPENAFAIFSSYTVVPRTGVDEDVSLNLGTNRWSGSPNTITKHVALDTSCNPFITGVLHVDTSANYGPYNSIANNNNTPWTIRFDASASNALLSVALNTQYNNNTGNSLITEIEDLSFNTQYALGGLGQSNPSQLSKYFTTGVNGQLVVNDISSNYILSDTSGEVTIPNNINNSLFGMYKFVNIEPDFYVTLYETDASGITTLDNTSDPAFPLLNGIGAPLYDTSLSYATFSALTAGYQTSQGWNFDVYVGVGGGYFFQGADTSYFTTDNSGVVNNHAYMQAGYQNQANILNITNGDVTLDPSLNANSSNISMGNIILDVSGGEQLNAIDAATNGQIILNTRDPISRALVNTQVGLTGTNPYIFYSTNDSSYSEIGATTTINTTDRTTQYVNYDFTLLHVPTGSEDLSAAATSNGASLYTTDQIAYFVSDICGTICPNPPYFYDAVHIHIGKTNSITQNGKMYELTDACYNAVDYYYTYNGDTSNYNYSYDNYYNPVNAIVNVDITNIELQQTQLENYRIFLEQKHIEDLCMNISDTNWIPSYYGMDTFLKTSANALAEPVAPSVEECGSIIANDSSMTITLTYKDQQTTANPSYLFDYVTISWGTSGEQIVIDESKIDFTNNVTTTEYTLLSSSDVFSNSGSYNPNNYKFVKVVVTELYNSSFILPYAAWNNLVMTTPQLKSVITFYEAYSKWTNVYIDGSGNLVASESQINPAILTHFTYQPNNTGPSYPMSQSTETIVDNNTLTQAVTTFVASKPGTTALSAVLQYANMADPLTVSWTNQGNFFDVDVYFGNTVNFLIPTDPSGSFANGTISITPEFISNILLLNLNVEYYAIPLKQNIKPIFLDLYGIGYNVYPDPYSNLPGTPFDVIAIGNYIYNDLGFLAAIDINIYYSDETFLSRVVIAGPFMEDSLDIWYSDTGLGIVTRTLDSQVDTYLVYTPQLTQIDYGVYLYPVNSLYSGVHLNFDLLPDQIAVNLIGPVTDPLHDISSNDIANGFTETGTGTIYIAYYRGYEIGNPNTNDLQYFDIIRTPGSMNYMIDNSFAYILADQSAVILSTNPYTVNALYDNSGALVGNGNLGLVLSSYYSFLPPSVYPPLGTSYVYLDVLGAPVNIVWGNSYKETDWSGNIVTDLKTYSLFTFSNGYQITSARVTSSYEFDYNIDYSFWQTKAFWYSSYVSNPLAINDNSWNFVNIQPFDIVSTTGLYFNNTFDLSNNSTDIAGNQRLNFKITSEFIHSQTCYYVFARPYLKFTELGNNGAQNVLFNIPSSQYNSAELYTKYLPVTSQSSGTTYNPFNIDASINNVTFTQEYDMCYNNYSFGYDTSTNYFNIVGSNIKITQIHNNGGTSVQNVMYNGPITNLNNYSNEALDVSGNRNAATNAYTILFPQDTSPILDESIGGVNPNYLPPQNIVVDIGNSVLPDASFNLILRPFEGTTVELYYWKNVKITDPIYFNDVSGASCYELTRLTTNVVNYALVPTAAPLQRVKLTPTSGEFALIDYPLPANILAVGQNNLNLSLFQKTLLATPTININSLKWRDVSGAFIDPSNNYIAYVSLTPITSNYMLGENDIVELLVTSSEIPVKMTSIYSNLVFNGRDGFGYRTSSMLHSGQQTAESFQGKFVGLINPQAFATPYSVISDYYADLATSIAGARFPNFPYFNPSQR